MSNEDTIQKVKAYIHKHKKDWVFVVIDDIWSLGNRLLLDQD